MSSFSIKGTSPGLYKNIDSSQRQYKFKESLINNPLAFSQAHPKLKAINNIEIFTCSEENSDPKPSSFEIPHIYKHSQLVLKAPALKSNHQFFWTMSYDPKPIVSSKFWGAFNRKAQIPENDNQNAEFSNKNNRKLRSGMALKRPTTKQSFRNTSKPDTAQTRPYTSSSTVTLRETLNFSGNDIEEFEYNAKRILKPANFIDNFECPHGLTNLRRKEANLFERMNGSSIRRSLKSADPYIAEFEKKMRGGQRRFNGSFKGIGLDRAIYEQNFDKARKIVGKSLENFKQLL